MSVQKISNAILGVGVDDTTIDLFESQYPVPTGVSYNSYVILDEKGRHSGHGGQPCHGCLAGKPHRSAGRPHAGISGGLPHGAGPWCQHCPPGR